LPKPPRSFSHKAVSGQYYFVNQFADGFSVFMPNSIRPARPEDVPVILGFIRALAAYEKLSHEVEADDDKLTRTLFPANGGAPAAHCILADSGDTPAGFAIYFFNYSTFLAQPGLYLEDLFVHPEFRGHGLGKMLLLHLARLANEIGCGRMEWTVLDWNQPAIDFYESLGAQRMREWQICRLTGPTLARYR
jgi:GNAT superfamily N-acetyltransferase